MEQILYTALIGGLSALFIGGISMLFKFLMKKFSDSTNDEENDDDK